MNKERPIGFQHELTVTSQVSLERLPIIEKISSGIGGLAVERVAGIEVGDLFESASRQAGRRVEDSKMQKLQDGNVVVKYHETEPRKISELHYQLRNVERQQAVESNPDQPSARWASHTENTYGATSRAPKKTYSRVGWL